MKMGLFQIIAPKIGHLKNSQGKKAPKNYRYSIRYINQGPATAATLSQVNQSHPLV